MSHYLVTVASRETPTAPHVEALYLLAGAQLTTAAVKRLAEELLHDPVVQRLAWCPLSEADLAVEPFAPAHPDTHLLEIAYRPGVTDNEAESVLEGARRLGVTSLEQAHTLRRYLLAPEVDPAVAVRDLSNDLIQTTLVYRAGQGSAARLTFYRNLLLPPATVPLTVTRVPLCSADDTELLRISREGVLALNLEEMHAIRDYFSQVGRDPSDGELETIAQTWSEHCSHKTFKARVRYCRTGPSDAAAHPRDPKLYAAFQMLEQDCEVDSLIRTFLMAATTKILTERQAQASTANPQSSNQDWVLSAFVDNAGIIAFTDDYEVSFKVETHNHPSALEPFGGANTGVGGVVRDVLGVSALPIANTDVLCFGPPDLPAAALLPGVLPPQRVCEGVVAGVRDYGNKLGIPTVNGAVLFDPGYTANPLVFCGTLGIAPRGAHPRAVQPGDAVVVLGGRTGRDGIHGATFSSVELTDTTATEVGTAVQIGDPITEKKMLDVLMQARDQRLYHAITDCGAGGLSSAVGEMGAETGVAVELAHVPLKYAGLQPWEIWLSEAQERMVLAIAPEHLQQFLDLCAAEDVEATPIGHFTADQRLRVSHNDHLVVDVAMDFLHAGRPQRLLDARWNPTDSRKQPAQVPDADHPSPGNILLNLLTHPNIASKERIVRTYDHEVGGATVIKPLVGVLEDGPGDAAVLQPVRTHSSGLALGCGINPRYGRIDPYWMALACIDEALRNIVAVGGDPSQTVILDNFCWGDPREPDRMAGLTRAAAGCYDGAVAFGTPFISGKDSLNNEYRDAQGNRVAIPPTLLISALALVPDVRRTVTMDLKEPGNRIYLIGVTGADLGGAHALDAGLVCTPANLEISVPRVDLAVARRTFAAMHAAIRSGFVRACHDLSEGGLAVAAAEMACAGGYGMVLDLRAVLLADASVGDAEPATLSRSIRLFAESPSRFLVEIEQQHVSAFEAALTDVPFAPVGRVTADPELRIMEGTDEVLRSDIATLKTAWQQGLAGLTL
jgi:phosphoribosylformylglycinamidine synthase